MPRRLEEAGVRVGHGPRGRDRRQVRGALVLAAGAQGEAPGAEEQRSHEQGGHEPKQQERRLAVLIAGGRTDQLADRHDRSLVRGR
jgi:hypothetical protein